MFNKCQNCQKFALLTNFHCQKISKLSKNYNIFEEINKNQNCLRLCFLITLIKCLKVHRFLASLFVCQVVVLSEWVTQWQGPLLSYSGQLKTNTNINYYFKVLLLLQKCFLSGSAVTKDISTTTENFAEALPDWKACKPKHIKYFSDTFQILTNIWRWRRNPVWAVILPGGPHSLHPASQTN